jgi:signal transduction histidine kinase
VGTPKLEYHWLLPSALDGGEAPTRRSTRDWVVDVLCFLLGFGFTVLVTIDFYQAEPSIVPQWAGTSPWLIWLDFAASTIAAVGLWWRRTRWLPLLAAYAVVLAVFTVAGVVSGLITLFTLAVHRGFPTLASYAVVVLGANAAFLAVRPDPTQSRIESFTWSFVLVAIICLCGMVVRARRQLVVSLRDRAERAEAEQQLRAEQARSLERTRIAREMHDVLAHRISLLSIHAGALEVKKNATEEELTAAAGVIRASAHQALQDLRQVIGILREDRQPGIPEPPQPTLGELPALADESRSAGVKVRLDVRIAATAVPDGTGRTAYRIVQEGLTNARKHAPGTAVSVAVDGAAGDGLTIDIRNPWPIAAVPTLIPGTGTGLVGLTERATLAGGRLKHGRTSQNEFALTAWLPWPE